MEGKYLQVWSKDNRWHFIPHDDPQLRGERDIAIPPYEKVMVSADWARQQAFVAAETNGFIASKITDEYEIEKKIEVPREIQIDDLPKLKLIAEQIVRSNISQDLQSILQMSVHDGNDAPDRAYMKDEFSRFLKYVQHLESKMRKRKTILQICETRLEEIRAM